MAFSEVHHFRMKALASELFQFRIGELATMTGVSTRQLRYWESKGIISSLEREGEQDVRDTRTSNRDGEPASGGHPEETRRQRAQRDRPQDPR